jgi:hypothetical protein
MLDLILFKSPLPIFYQSHKISLPLSLPLKQRGFRPCLDAPQKLKFFHSLSTSIFRPMHEVVNIGKKNN